MFASPGPPWHYVHLMLSSDVGRLMRSLIPFVVRVCALYNSRTMLYTMIEDNCEVCSILVEVHRCFFCGSRKIMKECLLGKKYLSNLSSVSYH